MYGRKAFIDYFGCILIALMFYSIASLSHQDTAFFLHSQAYGIWNGTTFTSLTLPHHELMQSNTKNTNYKPRILMIGDSINRNAIKAYCKSINSLVHEYTSCHGPGAHLACVNEVELTTFVIFGSALHEWSGQNELLRTQHLCSNMSHGTINRILHHLLPSVKNVYGNNTIDIITINAI